MRKYNQPSTKVLKSPVLMQDSTLPIVASEGTGQLGNEREFDEAAEAPMSPAKSVWED